MLYLWTLCEIIYYIKVILLYKSCLGFRCDNFRLMICVITVLIQRCHYLLFVTYYAIVVAINPQITREAIFNLKSNHDNYNMIAGLSCILS